MNIFILARYQTVGGMERMISSTANILAQSNEVHFGIRVKPDFDEKTITVSDNVKLVKLVEKPFPDISKLKNWFRVDWRYFWNLRNYLVRHKIDVIYAHDISIAQASLLKLLSRKPLVWHNHNGEMLDFSAPKKNKYKKYLFNTDAIISVNDTLTSYCKKHFPKRGRSFYSILNFVQIEPQKNVTELPSGFNIVYVANIRAVKNQLLLLSAFELFKQNNPDANLFFVGSGIDPVYENRLRNSISNSLYKNSIHTLGSKKDIMHILKQTHIAVLASLSEGSPLSLLEYGLAGIPVICSDIGICRQLLEEGNLGQLFKSNDKQSLADGLSAIRQNYKHALDKAEKFRNVIQTNYTRDQVIAGIQQVLLSAANEH